MNDAELAAALADGVALLRGIQRDPPTRSEQLEAYRCRYGALRPVLLTDHPPGSARTEHDLHLDHAELGGISLSWREQDGSPWALLYADHWAAQYVFAVDNAPVTIRAALTALRFAAGRAPDLLRSLTDRELIDQAARERAPTVTHDDIQAEVDRLRRELGLHEEETLRAWLSGLGMDTKAFIEAAADHVRRRQWTDTLTADRLRARFEQSPSDFDCVTLLDVTAASPEMAGRIRAEAATDAPWAVVGRWLSEVTDARIRRCFAFQSPVPAADAGCQVLFEIERTAASFDQRTASAIRDVLVQDWLEERRRSARIEWFWP